MARLLLAIALLAMGTLAHAQYSLSPGPVIKPIDGHWFTTVAIGDVNGDGHSDLVSITENHFLYVFLQQWNGALSAPMITNLNRFTCYQAVSNCPTDLANWPDEVVLGDLDGKVGKEIIVPSEAGLIVVSIRHDKIAIANLYGDGLTHLELSELALMDVNGDGKNDVIACKKSTTGNNFLFVFYGDGSGRILGHRALYSYVGFASSSAVADIDGDGLTDYLVSRVNGGGYIDIYYGQPLIGPYRFKGSLGQAQPVETYLVGGGAIAVADINSDGTKEIVHGVETHHQISPRVFSTPVDFSESTLDEWNLLSADLDGNGATDIASLSSHSTAVSYQLQHDGVLDQQSSAPLPTGMEYFGAHALAIGDINGDHCQDMAIVDKNSSLTWLLGNGCVQGPKAPLRQPTSLRH